MRLSFRKKLFLTLNIASLGFVFLIVLDEVLTTRVSRYLTRIEQRYVPLVELRPHLEATLDQMGRAFQDAVATQDEEALEAAATLRGEWLGRIDEAGAALDPATADALRKALDDYYRAASDVSLRLIRDESGIAIVEAITEMQQKLNRVRQILERTEIFNKETLAEAFRLIKNALRSTANLRLATGIVCLAAVIALALLLTRDMIRSLSALTAGLLRFGDGDFSTPIQVTNKNDEFASVAQSANRMAEQIQNLLKEGERKSAELETANTRLALTNRELEAFSYSVSHDLRAPLRAIDGFSKALLAEYPEQIDERGRHYLDRVRAATQRMSRLIDDLITLSRIARTPVRAEPIDMSALAQGIVSDLRARDSERQVDVAIEPDMRALGDAHLMTIALENLLGNSWKFTGKTAGARIQFGREQHDNETAFFVRDNGAGFDMAHAHKLFGAFQRLHSEEEFEGTGIGLATVQRIIHRHGGRIWGIGKPGEGATFFFTLGDSRK